MQIPHIFALLEEGKLLFLSSFSYYLASVACLFLIAIIADAIIARPIAVKIIVPIPPVCGIVTFLLAIFKP